ncbi:MAG: molecular chaperone HtpG, partial [Gammaproteobacteria bacterium]|nr:molecular chaperone HtpG [Gammaproteobacteria bacterium]
DFTNREALLKLLRFTSTGSKDDAQRTSLADYTGRMQADQDKIFYLVADNAQAGRQSPHLEVFAKQNIEVLLLTDRVDEWFMSFVNEFDGKQFQDVMRGDLDLSTDEAGKDDDPEDAEEDVDTLAKRIGDVLGDKVASVRRSRRLTESPSCLVLGEQDMGAQMRRIMEASGQTLPDTKPHFEFNPQHALIKSLEDADEERFANLVKILFDQASLADGAPLNEPGDYVRRINTLLVELLSPETPKRCESHRGTAD